MHAPRNGVKHCSGFRQASDRMAMERFRMENEGAIRPAVDNLALDVHALSIAAISKHGHIGKGMLEQIAVNAIHRADLRTEGRTTLSAEFVSQPIVEI